MIYARIMYMICLKQINLETALIYELVSTLTALFEENEEMWYPRAESILKTNLEVLVWGLIQQDPTVLWTIDWPNQGSVIDSAELMSQYI